MFKRNPLLTQPQNTTIKMWRYLSTEKLKELLENEGLFSVGYQNLMTDLKAF